MTTPPNPNTTNPSTPVSPKRKSGLDLLRASAACAVVLMHTVTGISATTDLSTYPTQATIFLMIIDLTSWCVPAFLLISGYLFLHPSRHLTYRQMIYNYCRRIAAALLCFGVPYACMELIAQRHTFYPRMIAESFVLVCQGKSWAHMWYLYLILFLYMITVPLKWLLRKTPRPYVIFFLIFLFTAASILPFIKKWQNLDSLPALPDNAIYLFYYLCGYLFAEKSTHPVSPAHPAERTLTGRILTGFAAILLCFIMVFIRLFVPDSVELPYNYPPTVLLALLLFSLALQVPIRSSNVSSLLKKLGNITFFVYLIHPVFLNIMYKFFHLSLLDYPLWLSIPVFFTITMLLSLVSSCLLAQILDRMRTHRLLPPAS